AVNRPGEYQYGQDMTIRDLLVLAGGFKMAASTNNIEISRVIIRNNQPTQTVVDKLEVDRSYNVIGFEGGYLLEPFDNIAVRYINEFELQQRVFLEGEVKFPGPYAISKKNERISSVINRAGGLSQEAFPAGATLDRSENDYGSIVIKLDEILNDPSSEFNFVVKNGDRITVPKTREFVTIRGATKVKEVVGEAAINVGNEIHVPYHQGKDAMFYINEYAGGLNELADRQKIFVEHANGEIKKPRNALFKKVYPKVLKGSTITVGYKTPEDPESKEQTDVDWTKVLGDSVAQAMSILTLILLIERLD
ncbi:MAG: SLBB domain-containing protein, partial [Bacteroidia bacterium]|nr:SLBB domain-containing protein [Bacteroidia bacterium]